MASRIPLRAESKTLGGESRVCENETELSGFETRALCGFEAQSDRDRGNRWLNSRQGLSEIETILMSEDPEKAACARYCADWPVLYRMIA